MGDYRIVSANGNQVEIIPTIGGKTKIVYISALQCILFTGNAIPKIPDSQTFGRKTKLRLNQDHIPDIK